MLGKISEHQEQCLFVELFRRQYPEYSKRLFAIPNGGLRNFKVAIKLQKEGVLPGVADLFFMHASCGYNGLFIEMKRDKKGVQSNKQKEFEQECKKAGYLYALCHGCDEAMCSIKEYINNNIQ